MGVGIYWGHRNIAHVYVCLHMFLCGGLCSRVSTVCDNITSTFCCVAFLKTIRLFYSVLFRSVLDRSDW